MARAKEFADGALDNVQSVREMRDQDRDPIREMQQHYRDLTVSAGYRPHSLLDSATRSGNGLGTADRARLLLNGQMLPSQNGVSEGDYQKRMNLGLFNL